MFIKVVNDHLRNRVPLKLEDDTNGFIRLIAGVTDAIQLFLLHQLRHPLDQLFGVDVVGNFGDDQLRFARTSVFHRDFATQLEGSSSRFVIGGDRFLATDQGARGEIRTGHDLENLFGRELRILNQGHNRINGLAQIMGRYVGGHAHGNTGSPVDNQIREGRR